MSLTICHLTSFKVGLQPGNRVARGDFLGTMKNHIHISLNDPYHGTSHSNCTQGYHAHVALFLINSGYFTIEGQSFDPGFDLNGNPIRDLWDATTIGSTNQENK